MVMLNFYWQSRAFRKSCHTMGDETRGPFGTKSNIIGQIQTEAAWGDERTIPNNFARYCSGADPDAEKRAGRVACVGGDGFNMNPELPERSMVLHLIGVSNGE
jgi:hypothetical protein